MIFLPADRCVAPEGRYLITGQGDLHWWHISHRALAVLGLTEDVEVHVYPVPSLISSVLQHLVHEPIAQNAGVSLEAAYYLRKW